MNRIRKILPTCVSVALACFVPAIGAAQETKAQPEYDIVIRGGRVLDGAGNPCILADVAVKDGRFVKVGEVYGSGQTKIDARVRFVSPGWIDMMDQSGMALTKNGLAENKLMEGVTTAIAGKAARPCLRTSCANIGRRSRRTASA